MKTFCNNVNNFLLFYSTALKPNIFYVPYYLPYFVLHHYTKNSVAVVRKRTIPTERPPLVGEVSANLWG
jgi:hypothetical protein